MTPVIEDRHKVASMALEQESSIRETLGNKMVDLGLTYQKLSDISGTSVQTIKNLIETHEGYKSETLLSIANHLGFKLALLPNENVPRISVSTEDDLGWSGWANLNGNKYLKDLHHAFEKVKKSRDERWIIIDADYFTAYVSDESVVDRAKKSANTNWGISLTNIKIGLPE